MRLLVSPEIRNSNRSLKLYAASIYTLIHSTISELFKFASTSRLVQSYIILCSWKIIQLHGICFANNGNHFPGEITHHNYCILLVGFRFHPALTLSASISLSLVFTTFCCMIASKLLSKFTFSSWKNLIMVLYAT